MRETDLIAKGDLCWIALYSYQLKRATHHLCVIWEPSVSNDNDIMRILLSDGRMLFVSERNITKIILD